MRDCDVLIIGSGAAGLTAAITAANAGCKVTVIEKASQFGGTTAWSGGAAWLPGNRYSSEYGSAEGRAAVSIYIQQILGEHFDAPMVSAFLDNAPEVLDFLEGCTSVARFERFPTCDYYPDLEGAALEGRSIRPLPFDGRSLETLLASLAAPMRELCLFGDMQMDPVEAVHVQNAFRSWSSFKVAAHLVSRIALDRLSLRRSTRLIRGQALVARLLLSARDLGVDLQSGTAATGLTIRDNRVAGAEIVERTGRIAASRGVIVATGGFSANRQMLREHMPFSSQHLVMLPETNQGDGIGLAQHVGGQLGTDNLSPAIWMPASASARRNGGTDRYPHFALDRCKPGSLMLNAFGERFTNEAASYHHLVGEMHSQGVVPAWLIADRRFVKRYGMGLTQPSARSIRRHVENGYLIEAASIDDLADKLGMDAGRVRASFDRFNSYADAGVDEQFGRGRDPYTRMLGDPGHKPNPSLGRIEHAPYYALALYPSDCGTALGLRTDEKARVIGPQGQPVAGLYACGLDMNSALRGSYPGSGTMLGLGMTFGYIAGKHIASPE